MTRPGPLALLGGGEHLPPCRDIDRWLLEATGRDRPEVLVLPAAALPRGRAATASLARNWWRGLGATCRVAVPGRDPESAVLAAVATADLVVLPGGIPERLVGALGASRVVDAVLDRWHDGAGLAGSSAGAMALFAWRLRIASPRPFALAPGLGAVHGWVAVPHFERFVGGWGVGRRFAERHRRRLRGLGVLGIDESTALVCHEGRSHVLGRGAVTLGDRDGWRVHHSPTTLALDLPTVAPLRDTGKGRPPRGARAGIGGPGRSVTIGRREHGPGASGQAELASSTRSATRRAVPGASVQPAPPWP